MRDQKRRRGGEEEEKRIRDGRVDGGGGGRGADDPPIEKSDASRVASASAARRSRTSYGDPYAGSNELLHGRSIGLYESHVDDPRRAIVRSRFHAQRPTDRTGIRFA